MRFPARERSSILTPGRAQRLVDEALDRRAAANPPIDSTALRLVHAAADGLPGLVIEQFGEVLVAQLHDGTLSLDEPVVRTLCEHAARRVGAHAVYRKWFPRDRSAARPRLEAQHTDPTPWIDLQEPAGRPVPPEFPIVEHELKLLVRPYDGFSVGLFLDQRDNRRRIRTLARGRRVLNLFAYTCGFSVAAAAGGGLVTSVDVSRKHLEWGKRNFAQNGLPLDGQTFILSDALAYFARAWRQGRTFEIVIADPPAFGRDKSSGRVFSLNDDLGRLLEGALLLLEPGGTLLFSTNQRSLPTARIERTLADAAAGRRIRSQEWLTTPPDFHGDPDYCRSLLVGVD